MKTVFAKQIPNLERKWFVVDAKGKNLWRLATGIARVITGRNRVDYTPNTDNGAYVVVINAKDVTVTGKKEKEKMYRTHSQFMGGLKEIALEKMREKDPTHIIAHAVIGMLPKTKHRDAMMLRLRVVSGSNHSYEAQKPTSLDF